MIKTLHLTLSKAPFEVMVTGEKTEEFRDNSDWMMSRLVDKNENNKSYDLVKFTNGYGNDKPYFIAEYLGWCYPDELHELIFSNGLKVNVGLYTIVIKLGKIIEKGNLN